MKWRRVLAIVLSGVLGISMLSGCGRQQSSSETVPQQAEEKEEEGKVEMQGDTGTAKRVLKWSLASAQDHPFAITAQEAAKEIEEATGIEVQVYTAAQLAGDADGVDMCRAGSIDILTVGLQTIMQYQEDLQGLLMPFTFDDDYMAERYHIEYLMPEVLNGELLNTTNMYALAIKNNGQRELTTKGIEVHSPEDLRGQKIRSMEQPISIATIKALGAAPVPVAYSELYMAMQTGVVNGQDNPIANVLAAKFYEVQDYLILTNHQPNMNADFINLDLWNSLTEEERTKIQEIMTRYQGICNDRIREGNLETLEELKANGMTVIEDIDLKAFKESADQVIGEEFGGSEYDSWRAVRQQALDWCEENKGS
ncbi:MAG: TRAP transporter substrate-binding protein [Lachnospiraceae bacterium]|nr:TRAP transporter substrate-binding protein [Lachnospiraceae bacterium]